MDGGNPAHFILWEVHSYRSPRWCRVSSRQRRGVGDAIFVGMPCTKILFHLSLHENLPFVLGNP